MTIATFAVFSSEDLEMSSHLVELILIFRWNLQSEDRWFLQRFALRGTRDYILQLFFQGHYWSGWNTTRSCFNLAEKWFLGSCTVVSLRRWNLLLSSHSCFHCGPTVQGRHAGRQSWIFLSHVILHDHHVFGSVAVLSRGDRRPSLLHRSEYRYCLYYLLEIIIIIKKQVTIKQIRPQLVKLFVQELIS